MIVELRNAVLDAAFAGAEGFRMEQWPEEIRALAALVADAAPQRILEIGVRYGGTAALWCGLASQRVVAVDWPEREGLGPANSQDVRQRLAERFHHYRGIFGNSREEVTIRAVAGSLGGRVDLLFIDGDHSYAGAKADWERYRPYVREGGLIAFHDIVDTPFIRSTPCRVFEFWRELDGDKQEFVFGSDWGGIGVVRV